MDSIFKITSGNSEAYVVALSIIHALQVFCAQNVLDIDDLGCEDQIKEVFPSSWSRISFEKFEYEDITMNLQMYMNRRKRGEYEVIFER